MYNIVKASCAKCHDVNKKSGDFALINVANKSLLNLSLADRVIVRDLVEIGEMPPQGELSATQKGVFRKWVLEQAQRERGSNE